MALTIVLTHGSAVDASTQPCPDPASPKTCERYSLYFDPGWAGTDDGTFPIRYYINPTQPFVPEKIAIDAIQAGFATWQAWNPSIRFTYMGTTSSPPVPHDGRNVLGWGSGLGGVAVTWWPPLSQPLIEADVMFDLTHEWGWFPCEQSDGSCVTPPFGYRSPITTLPVSDIQAFATHEIGHVLGLGHVGDTNARFLTMSGNRGCCDLHRTMITLGLGDILGARALYPWTCPAPDANGGYPTRFQRVCPTIQVFDP